MGVEATVQALLAALRATKDTAACVEGLRQLRRFSQEARHRGVVVEYFRQSPGASELLAIYDEQAHAKNHVVVGELCLLLRRMFDMTFEGQADQWGTKGIQHLLDDLAYALMDKRMKALCTYIAGDSLARANAAWLLLGALARRGPGATAALLDTFELPSKAVGSVSKSQCEEGNAHSSVRLTKERKVDVDDLKRMPSRDCFIDFVLSVLQYCHPSFIPSILGTRSLKAGLLFNLSQDDSATAVKILQGLEQCLPRLPSTSALTCKFELFEGRVLEQLAVMSAFPLGRVEQLAGQMAHNLLSQVCTEPSYGLLPPRDCSIEEISAQRGFRRLLSFLPKLHPFRCLSDVELIVKIGKACPRLAAEYIGMMVFKPEEHKSPEWFPAMGLTVQLIPLCSACRNELVAKQARSRVECQDPDGLLDRLIAWTVPPRLDKACLAKLIQVDDPLVVYTVAGTVLQFLQALGPILDDPGVGDATKARLRPRLAALVPGTQLLLGAHGALVGKVSQAGRSLQEGSGEADGRVRALAAILALFEAYWKWLPAAMRDMEFGETSLWPGDILHAPQSIQLGILAALSAASTAAMSTSSGFRHHPTTVNLALRAFTGTSSQEISASAQGLLCRWLQGTGVAVGSQELAMWLGHLPRVATSGPEKDQHKAITHFVQVVILSVMNQPLEMQGLRAQLIQASGLKGGAENCPSLMALCALDTAIIHAEANDTHPAQKAWVTSYTAMVLKSLFHSVSHPVAYALLLREVLLQHATRSYPLLPDPLSGQEGKDRQTTLMWLLPPEGHPLKSMWKSMQDWFLSMEEANPALLQHLILDSAVPETPEDPYTRVVSPAYTDLCRRLKAKLLKDCVIWCAELPHAHVQALRMWIPHMEGGEPSSCYWRPNLPHNLMFYAPKEKCKETLWKTGPNPLLDPIVLFTVLMCMPAEDAMEFLKAIVDKYPRRRLGASFWRACVKVIRGHCFPKDDNMPALTDALRAVQSRGRAFSNVLSFSTMVQLSFQCPGLLDVKATWVDMTHLVQLIPEQWLAAAVQLLCSGLIKCGTTRAVRCMFALIGECVLPKDGFQHHAAVAVLGQPCTWGLYLLDNGAVDKVFRTKLMDLLKQITERTSEACEEGMDSDCRSTVVKYQKGAVAALQTACPDGAWTDRTMRWVQHVAQIGGYLDPALKDDVANSVLDLHECLAAAGQQPDSKNDPMPHILELLDSVAIELCARAESSKTVKRILEFSWMLGEESKAGRCLAGRLLETALHAHVPLWQASNRSSPHEMLQWCLKPPTTKCTQMIAPLLRTHPLCRTLFASNIAKYKLNKEQLALMLPAALSYLQMQASSRHAECRAGVAASSDPVVAAYLEPMMAYAARTWHMPVDDTANVSSSGTSSRAIGSSLENLPGQAPQSGKVDDATEKPLSNTALKCLHQYAIPVLMHCLAARPWLASQQKKVMKKILWPSGWPLDDSETEPFATRAEQAALAAFLLMQRSTTFGHAESGYKAFLEDLATFFCSCTATLAAMRHQKLQLLEEKAAFEQQLWAHINGFVRERIAELPDSQRVTETFNKVIHGMQSLAETLVKYELDDALIMGSLRRFFEAALPQSHRCGERQSKGSNEAIDSHPSSDDDQHMPDADVEGADGDCVAGTVQTGPKEQVEINNPFAAAVAAEVLDALWANPKLMEHMKAYAPMPLAVTASHPISSLSAVVMDASRRTEEQDWAMNTSNDIGTELGRLMANLLAVQTRFGIGLGTEEPNVATHKQRLVSLLSVYQATLSPKDVAIRQSMLILEEWITRQSPLAASESQGIGKTQQLRHEPLLHRRFLWGGMAEAVHKECNRLDEKLSHDPPMSQTANIGATAPDANSHLGISTVSTGGWRSLILNRAPVDPVRCAWTCVHYPEEADVPSDGNVSAGHDLATFACYDPAHLLPFCVHIMEDRLLAPSLFCKWGLLALCFRSLSAANGHIRELAYGSLELFFSNLQSQGRFQAKDHILALMKFFRRGIVQTNQRLPSISTMFLAEASLQLLNPDGPLTSMLVELLRRSALDTTCVPLFNRILTSGVQECGQEQQWLLQMLWAGLKENGVSDVYRRRCTIEMVMTLCHSKLAQPTTRGLALRVVHRVTAVPKLATFLAEHSGLVTWLGDVVGETACPPHGSNPNRPALVPKAKDGHQAPFPWADQPPAMASISALTQLLTDRVGLRGPRAVHILDEYIHACWRMCSWLVSRCKACWEGPAGVGQGETECRETAEGCSNRLASAEMPLSSFGRLKALFRKPKKVIEQGSPGTIPGGLGDVGSVKHGEESLDTLSDAIQLGWGEGPEEHMWMAILRFLDLLLDACHERGLMTFTHVMQYSDMWTVVRYFEHPECPLAKDSLALLLEVVLKLIPGSGA
ncbi:unnamed protein product, partial [Ostreobium quekettii]|eukprot:evm.model.scf_444.6 EVM.evm.TU.scf_444.6   scf_444:70609-87837(+)